VCGAFPSVCTNAEVGDFLNEIATDDGQSTVSDPTYLNTSVVQAIARLQQVQTTRACRAGVPACRIGIARQATRLPYKFDDANGADGKSRSAEFA
jgi:hypothetical protein